MDFATNCDLLNEVREKVETAAKEILEYKTTIFAGIDGLGEAWSGESFNTFKEKCHSYEGAIDSLVTILKSYGKMIGNVEQESSELVNNVRSRLEN